MRFPIKHSSSSRHVLQFQPVTKLRIHTGCSHGLNHISGLRPFYLFKEFYLGFTTFSYLIYKSKPHIHYVNLNSLSAAYSAIPRIFNRTLMFFFIQMCKVAPTWSINCAIVVVTFMRPTKGDTQGDNLDGKIQKAIIDNPNVTTEDLARQFGVTAITIKHYVAKMLHIPYVGSGYSGHWVVDVH